MISTSPSHSPVSAQILHCPCPVIFTNQVCICDWPSLSPAVQAAFSPALRLSGKSPGLASSGRQVIRSCPATSLYHARTCQAEDSFAPGNIVLQGGRLNQFCGNCASKSNFLSGTWGQCPSVDSSPPLSKLILPFILWDCSVFAWGENVSCVASWYFIK